MGSIIKVLGVILVLLSSTVVTPSSAQDAACWDSIASCLETAKAQNYADAAVQPCCPDLSDAITNDRPCFCLGQADLVSQGADAQAIFNGVLGTCSISGTMDSICSANPPSTPSGTPSTSNPTTSPPAPSAVVPSPSEDASSPSDAPSMAAASTGGSHKIATTSISSLFMILMSFTIVRRT